MVPEGSPLHLNSTLLELKGGFFQETLKDSRGGEPTLSSGKEMEATVHSPRPMGGEVNHTMAPGGLCAWGRHKD